MDLGRRVKIHRGSRFERLLWRVTDLRAFSKERMGVIYNSRGYAHPDSDTVNHVFFTCPENAAKAYGWESPSDEKVYEFYKQRDALLHDSLPRDQLQVPWWETPRFSLDGVDSLKCRGVEAWELHNKLRYNHEHRTYEIRRTVPQYSTSEFLDD